MPDEVHGFEEKGDEHPWCVQCSHFLKWPYHDECIGCLSAGGRPAETVSFRTVHWDTAVLHAVIRRKVAVWEQRHPGWELAPDFARYWEDSTHPSKYVDRETGIGRKMAWTRFVVERKHPRGGRPMGQVVEQRLEVAMGPDGFVWVEGVVEPGHPCGALALTIRPGSALWQAVQDPASVRRNLEVLGLLRGEAGGEASGIDRDELRQGVRQMAEPDESEVESPSPGPEPEDVPEPAPPAPAEDEEAEEAPA